MVERYGHQDLWKKGTLPDILHEAHEELKRDVDGLTSFLSEGPLVFGIGKYVPEKEFIQAYKEYRDGVGLTTNIKWGPDHYMNVFDENEITIDTSDNTRIWPNTSECNGEYYKGPFIMGIDLDKDDTPSASNSFQNPPQSEAKQSLDDLDVGDIGDIGDV